MIVVVYCNICTKQKGKAIAKGCYVMLMASSKGNFVIRILDQQHSSWQGTVTWLATNKTKPFRSTMELILMVDDALRDDIDVKAAQPP